MENPPLAFFLNAKKEKEILLMITFSLIDCYMNPVIRCSLLGQFRAANPLFAWVLIFDLIYTKIIYKLT